MACRSPRPHPMSPFLLIAGLLVFWYACRTFHNRYLHKLGAIAFLAASFSVGFFLGGNSVAWGCASAAFWIVLPWFEILTRVRKLRLPLRHELRPRHPPNRDTFPDLPDLTQTVEDLGFERVADLGWEWQGVRQFVRVFYNHAERAQASICMNEQDEIAFAYVSVSSRTDDGRTVITWDYPFSYTMQFAPRQRVQRVPSGTAFPDLFMRHRILLQRGDGLDLSPQIPAQIVGEIERETRIQIDHNLAKGLIRDAGEGTFRYSWRGCFFLWFQLVKDMIRV